MTTLEYSIRRSDENDRNWIDEYIAENWGSNKVIVLSEIFTPSRLRGFIAESRTKKLGLVTYEINYPFCQIITLDSNIKNRGIGTKLIENVISEARLKGCNKIKLFTTNDNLNALNFYQNRGFQIIKIYHDSIKDARKLKPEIPHYGQNGIYISDEIELVLNLDKNF